MKILFILLVALNLTFAYAGNLEVPNGSVVLYNSKEPGYFRINCNLLNSNKMSCAIGQLFFGGNPADGSCAISWTTHDDDFIFNISNSTWSSIKEQNNECGVINISSLSKTKDGSWLYKFKTHVRFPNNKTKGLKSSCSIYEDIKGTVYTSKYKPVNIKCNGFVLLPF